MPHCSDNFSINQVRWIGHSNISWNSGNWIYELQENHIRTYSINLKSLQYDIIEDNLKKSQKWDKEVNKIEIKKHHRKINNINEWQRKTSCGYVNNLWLEFYLFIFFFYLGFLSRTLTNHRTAGEGISLTPHYHFHQSHTRRQYPGDYCRELTSVHS